MNESIETKAYSDGSVATGRAPLPSRSPMQQMLADAMEVAELAWLNEPEKTADMEGRAFNLIGKLEAMGIPRCAKQRVPSSTATESDERSELEAFEAWYFDRYTRPVEKNAQGGYLWSEDRDMLEAWQASAAVAAQPEAGEAVGCKLNGLPDALREAAGHLSAIMEEEIAEARVIRHFLPDELEGFALMVEDLASAPTIQPTQPVQEREAPLAGRWHHGNGVLVSGSIRIARWDCDTNPPDEFRDEVLDWVCDTLNAALSATPAQAGDAGEPSDKERAGKVCAVCGGSDWLPGCFTDRVPTLCLTCLGNNQPRGRNCPACKHSDSWGIPDKACLAACSPTPDRLGSAFQALNPAARTTPPPAPVLLSDAEKYQWLRAEHQRVDPLCHLSWKKNSDRDGTEWVNTHDLDEAIEQAIGRASREASK